MRNRVAFAIVALLSWLASTPAAAANYSDIWWNPAESGWGVTIADHETNIFAVLYTYRSDGRPVWFALSGGTFSQGRRMFTGDMYLTHGPAYTNAVFNPNLVTATKVGTATFDFSPPGQPAGSASLSYTINGVSQTKQIQRQPFGSAAPSWGTDNTDIWYSASQSGWGLSVAQHGNNIFAVWYAYDTDGEPLWFALSGGTFSGTGSFTGALYRTTGPYFGNATFNPSSVVATQAGTATLTFSGTASAASADKVLATGFSRTIGGITYQTPLLQQPFGNAAPKPVAGSCVGTYTFTIALPLCNSTFGANGAFTTTGVNFNQQGPFAGFVTLTNEPVIFSGTGVGDCYVQSLTGETVAFNGAMNLSSIGSADFVIAGGELAVHAQFSLGSSTVLGTLTSEYGSGRFSCSY